MPPLAEPSSLVSTTPVTSVASAKARAWLRPFCPVVASMTSSVSATAPGSRSATRRTLASSSMRFLRFCSLPAVSASTTSAPRAAAALTASWTTELGSAPELPDTSSAPQRSAQVCSWSVAAARKVSPAAITTDRPCAVSRAPTLPMVVVLPTPFTPTNNQTGVASSRPSAASANVRLASRSARICSASAPSRSSASAMPCSEAVLRRRSNAAMVVATPTSAPSSASSRLSQVAASGRRPRIDARRSRSVRRDEAKPEANVAAGCAGSSPGVSSGWCGDGASDRSGAALVGSAPTVDGRGTATGALGGVLLRR